MLTLIGLFLILRLLFRPWSCLFCRPWGYWGMPGMWGRPPIHGPHMDFGPGRGMGRFGRF